MKKFAIIICCILLQIVVISGCISEENLSNSDYSPKLIMVSGVDTIKVINNRDATIRLMVSGVRNDVTVSEDTQLIDIMLSGVNCIVRVSRSHSFTSTISGVGSQIVYYD